MFKQLYKITAACWDVNSICTSKSVTTIHLTSSVCSLFADYFPVLHLMIKNVIMFWHFAQGCNASNWWWSDDLNDSHQVTQNLYCIKSVFISIYEGLSSCIHFLSVLSFSFPLYVLIYLSCLFFNAVDAQHDVKQAIKMQWGFCQTPVCVFE